MEKEVNISIRCKGLLESKYKECQVKIKKLKRKRKIIKVMYATSIIASVSLSVALVSVSGFIFSPIVITSLSAASGILTGISAKFNLSNQKTEITKLIQKLNEIRNKIDYVLSLNGDLSHEEYIKIIKDINQ
jgi:hypothetical protein